MRQVHRSRTQWVPVVGALCVAALLVVLSWSGDTGPVGWATGLASGVVGCVLLARGLARRGRVGLGPADRVTLARLVLSCGVAALTATALATGVEEPAVVPLATVALVLDWVDGRVARLTSSVSELGARFDMETDAFLILVLSVYVADAMGWWVLAIGLARYAFVASGWVWPWLRGGVPPRYWCKVVAATQGVALTVAAAALLPAVWATTMLVAALGMLAESFGREAWQLWQPRSAAAAGAAGGRPRELVAVGRAAHGLSDA